MEKKEHRRKSKRYPISWEATVILDKVDGTLVVDARTQDISSGGASILSEFGDRSGTPVTLVLMPPARGGGNETLTFRVRARIVSSVRRPSSPEFRHGLSFILSPGDGVQFLEELLKAVRPVNAGIANLKMQEQTQHLYAFNWRITYRAGREADSTSICSRSTSATRATGGGTGG